MLENDLICRDSGFDSQIDRKTKSAKRFDNPSQPPYRAIEVRRASLPSGRKAGGISLIIHLSESDVGSGFVEFAPLPVFYGPANEDEEDDDFDDDDDDDDDGDDEELDDEEEFEEDEFDDEPDDEDDDLDDDEFEDEDDE